MPETTKRRERATTSRSTGDPNIIGGARASVPSTCKLNEETATAIVNAVRAGNTNETAAAYAGINKDTLYTWMRKGRAAERGAYRDFVEALDHALASSEVRDLALIGKAAEEQWQAAAWRLERRYPDRYGRRTRHEGQIDIRGVPFLDYSRLDPADMEDLHRILEKGNPGVDEVPSGGRPALELLEGGTT